MASNQNTLIMMPGDVMKSVSLKAAHIETLTMCSTVTGRSLSRLLNEALDNYINDVAPVLMNKADPMNWNWEKRPAVRR